MFFFDTIKVLNFNRNVCSIFHIKIITYKNINFTKYTTPNYSYNSKTKNPNDLIFKGINTEVRRQIRNAVPAVGVYWFAREIERVLERNKP